MSCERIVGTDGQAMGFIRTRVTSSRPPCEQCGADATVLCDYPLGGSKKGKTCDKKLCRRCAVRVDAASLPRAIRHPAKLSGSHIVGKLQGDTVDVCPAHARYIRAKTERED